MPPAAGYRAAVALLLTAGVLSCRPSPVHASTTAWSPSVLPSAQGLPDRSPAAADPVTTVELDWWMGRFQAFALQSSVAALAPRASALQGSASRTQDALAHSRDRSDRVALDLDQIRSDLAAARERLDDPATGGFGALVQIRFAVPSSTNPGYGQSGKNGDFFPGAAQPSATRYRGGNGLPGTALGGTSDGSLWHWDWPEFTTISQLSLLLDRGVTSRVRFHGQVDLNAEGFDPIPGPIVRGFARIGGVASSTLEMGRGRGDAFRSSGFTATQEAQVNQSWALATVGDDLTLKAGVFALPFSDEHTGPARTTQATLTPSAIATHWEHMRPIGLELAGGAHEEPRQWQLGVALALNPDGMFFGLGGARPGGIGGTLLSGFQVLEGGVPVDAYGQPSTSKVGRLPTGRLAVLTDAPVGAFVSDSRGDPLGLYGRYQGGWRNRRDHWTASAGGAWSGGDIRPGASAPSLSRWWATQLGLAMRNDDDTLKNCVYYARTENASPADLATDARLPSTPFPNAARDDTVTVAARSLIEHRCTRRVSASMLVEWIQEDTGLARLSSEDWIFAWNRRFTPHQLLQVEYLSRSNVKARSDAGFVNTLEPDDDQVQVSFTSWF